MGKHSQPRNINGIATTDKTNPSFKWARMLHLLDYHRWHYVKKVLAHKKHSDHGTNGLEGGSNVTYTYEPRACARDESMESLPIEQCTDACLSTKSSPSPASPRTKSSRASRIRKMIAKEVTKRRGRHRRSSTCPAVSTLATHDPTMNPQLEGVANEGVVDTDQLIDEPGKCQADSVHSEGDQKKCELCNTMQIECQLGERKQVVDHGGEQQLDQIKKLLQEIPDEAIDELSLGNNNLGRSASFQHSKEFLDAMDVLSVNKQFFLRILDDPGSSLRHHFLAQQVTQATQAQAAASKRKFLSKSGTFPINQPSNDKNNSSPNQFKTKQKSYISKDKCSSNQSWADNPSTSSDTRVMGKRFKSLKQKLKHAIRESKKERRRIAMDAVFHKVPYGHKVNSDEIGATTRDSPRVSMSECDFSISPCSLNTEGDKDNNRNRRSSSLDDCLDRYCQLFEATSFSREANKIDTTPDRPRLRVMDDNSYRNTQKGLGRILSSPDLQMFLSHRSEDFDGHVSSKMPNRGVMSFNEQKVREVMSKEDFEEVVNTEEVVTEDMSNKIEDMASSHEDKDVVEIQATPLQVELIPAAVPVDDGQVEFNSHAETIVEDLKSAPPQEPSDQGSPTFACTQVDDDQVHTVPLEPPPPISPTLHQLQVTTKDEAKFNYVKEILQLSGYSSTQLLGTWYSSEQPVDPSVFVELESCSFLEPECSPSKQDQGIHSSRLLLFDLINEILLTIYERSVSYWPSPLTSCSHTHPMPKGYRVLEEVWSCISWYMACSKPLLDPSLDYITTRDLAKDDRWMNLQFDAECVGLEVEDLIFDELLIELLS